MLAVLLSIRQIASILSLMCPLGFRLFVQTLLLLVITLLRLLLILSYNRLSPLSNSPVFGLWCEDALQLIEGLCSCVITSIFILVDHLSLISMIRADLTNHACLKLVGFNLKLHLPTF